MRIEDDQTSESKKQGNGALNEGLSALNRNAAGIDVGNAEHYVAVREGRDPEPVQTFGSFTSDLHRMAQWLKACSIDTIVMQATGVYWIALFQILENYGFHVNVVNARHTKTLPGRQTDVLECQWLQKLHTFGLFNIHFVRQRKSRYCDLTSGSGRIWWPQVVHAFSICRKRSRR
jgi:transposase